MNRRAFFGVALGGFAAAAGFEAWGLDWATIARLFNGWRPPTYLGLSRASYPALKANLFGPAPVLTEKLMRDYFDYSCSLTARDRVHIPPRKGALRP